MSLKVYHSLIYVKFCSLTEISPFIKSFPMKTQETWGIINIRSSLNPKDTTYTESILSNKQLPTYFFSEFEQHLRKIRNYELWPA